MDTEAYKREAALMLEAVEAAFPHGCRVRYRDAKTGNWSGTVKRLEGQSRRATAPDRVFVLWDNHNAYSVSVDEIERI